MGILNNLKQKPDNQKKIFSLVTAIILTLVIVVVWFSFTDNSVDNNFVSEGNKLSSISPIQLIKEEFSKAFSGFKDATEAIKEISSTTPDENNSDLMIGTSTEDFSTSSVEVGTTSENIN
jgi:hypothetical protein